MRALGLKRSCRADPPLFAITERLARHDMRAALLPMVNHAARRIEKGFAVWKAARYLIRSIKLRWPLVELISDDDEEYIFRQLIRHAERTRTVIKADYPPRIRRRLWG